MPRLKEKFTHGPSPFRSGTAGVTPITPHVAHWPAPKARWQWRHVLALLSFLVCVLLPIGLTAAYLWGRAADQYASEAGFAVRQEEARPANGVFGVSATVSSRDMDILYEYLSSKRLVTELEENLTLSALWSKPGTDPYSGDTDPVFAFPADGALEALHAYWQRRVAVSYDARAGLMQVRVTAFAAEDAQVIATAIVDRASALINELSDVARNDAIEDAAHALAQAEERLSKARSRVTVFRNKHQMVDPQVDMQVQMGLLGTLQAQLAEALIALDLLRESTQQGGVRLEQSLSRVGIIKARIAEERAKLGLLEGADAAPYATLIGQYDVLTGEVDLAERAYAAAVRAHDAAQAVARQQSRYLAAWQDPTLPETAEYPQRLRILAMVTVFCGLIWGLGILSVWAARDRRRV